ncbi:hypothetical protein MKZ38_010386 [Zalerion maritima]|uniref:Uncharacterized protein n=1 Tax=Zalerion maritima TaxID=339359 RepID=A0AAD5RT76_9PEZI|nr:hypothetical protein MKZ38_010386 [Zalerion maritima]
MVPVARTPSQKMGNLIHSIEAVLKYEDRNQAEHTGTGTNLSTPQTLSDVSSSIRSELLAYGNYKWDPSSAQPVTSKDYDNWLVIFDDARRKLAKDTRMRAIEMPLWNALDAALHDLVFRASREVSRKADTRETGKEEESGWATLAKMHGVPKSPTFSKEEGLAGLHRYAWRQFYCGGADPGAADAREEENEKLFSEAEEQSLWERIAGLDFSVSSLLHSDRSASGGRYPGSSAGARERVLKTMVATDEDQHYFSGFGASGHDQQRTRAGRFQNPGKKPGTTFDGVFTNIGHQDGLPLVTDRDLERKR